MNGKLRKRRLNQGEYGMPEITFVDCECTSTSQRAKGMPHSAELEPLYSESLPLTVAGMIQLFEPGKRYRLSISEVGEQPAPAVEECEDKVCVAAL